MFFQYRVMEIEKKVPVRVPWNLQVAIVVKQQYRMQLLMKVNTLLQFIVSFIITKIL